ncbi:peptidase M16-like protein [Sandaracinus amylolyticus]|uniref:Peptidase M16-like protein n=1 Tax=Sandaracinus amylolyticus TaxID=927083 RepID=A0A0F6SE91_9BACT|nr:peptidase M16-like protein [Sandaracinus amylolyticus]
MMHAGCGGASRATLPAPHRPLVRTRDDASRAPPPLATLPLLEVPEVHRTTLATGLDVQVVPRTELPLVAIVVASRAFHIHDPGSPRGAASLTARVMERELGRMALAARGRELAAPDVTAGGDGLLIAMQVPSTEVVPALTMLSAVLRAEDCFAADVELARVAHRELVARAQTVGRLASLGALVSLYGPEDPRSAPSYGSALHVERLQRAHCIAQRRRGLLPASTTIAIAGDITPEEAFAHVQGTLGAWARTGAAVPPAPPPTFPQSERNLLLVPVRSEEGSLMIVERGPGPDEPGFPAFAVLTRMLGGMFAARMNIEVRERRGWAYGVSAELGVAADHSTVRVECTVRGDRLLDTLQVFEHELWRLREPARIEADELATAVSMERATLRTQLEARTSVAYALARAFLHGRTLADHARLDAALASLRSDDVARAAASFRLGAAPVVMIGPRELAPALARARPGRFGLILPP